MYFKRLILPALLIFNVIIQAQNIPTYVPANGLVGWWPFSGNAFDSSGTGNNGTALSVLSTNDRFGKANAAYAFNGSNSRIEIPDAAAIRCRKITMSAWVLNNNISRISQVIYKGSLYAAGEAYSLFSSNVFGTAIKIGSNCNTAVGWKGGSSRQPTSPGSWEHLVATYDGSIYKMYKNGVLDTSMVTAGLMDSCIGGGLRFGYNHNLYSTSTGDGFDGVLDDIGIWNRALDENEVKQLYSGLIECNNGGNLGINVCEPQRSLHVKDVIRLEPRSFSPPNPSKGDLYFDGTINKLRCYDGTSWRDCW